MTLDEVRLAKPELGVAVYAMEPGGVVTLELYADGQVYSFTGATEQEAIDKAFPPTPVSSVPPVASPAGAVAAESETVSAGTRAGLTGGTPEPSVFD